PSQYPALQREAAELAASLAAPRRVLALLGALCDSAAAAAALHEATVWQANARAWCERFGQQYAWYPDLSQPVQLAVYEMIRGVALLAAAAPASSPAAHTYHAAAAPAAPLVPQ
ncbi:hypothetical protein Agub_g2045, partial [Astrephomene gubernaculifera]